MSDGFSVGDLGGVANAVGGATRLGGLTTPASPDAGAASASVAGALAAMTTVVTRVVGTAAAARQQVTANDRAYRDADRAAAAAFTANGGDR
jgi:hypothetical protein